MQKSSEQFGDITGMFAQLVIELNQLRRPLLVIATIMSDGLGNE